MKYCSPWKPAGTKFKTHLVSRVYVDDHQPHWGGMKAEIYELSTGQIHYDIYGDRGGIVASGFKQTIEEAKAAAEAALKADSWRIIEGKYAVML